MIVSGARDQLPVDEVRVLTLSRTSLGPRTSWMARLLHSPRHQYECAYSYMWLSPSYGTSTRVVRYVPVVMFKVSVPVESHSISL